MEKPLKHYVVEVRGEEGLERTFYLTGTSAREVRQQVVARGYKVVRIRLDRRPRQEVEREEAEEAAHPAAAVRVANVVLAHAASEGARTISVEMTQRSMKISYLVGDDWREVMTTPLQVWPPLRRRFAELAGLSPEEQAEQTGELTFSHGEQSRTARVTLLAEGARIELGG